MTIPAKAGGVRVLSLAKRNLLYYIAEYAILVRVFVGVSVNVINDKLHGIFSSLLSEYLDFVI